MELAKERTRLLKRETLSFVRWTVCACYRKDEADCCMVGKGADGVSRTLLAGAQSVSGE